MKYAGVCRIMKLMESGFMNRWQQQHWPRLLCRTGDTRVFNRKFMLADMEGNFYIILIGTLVAFAVLLLECRRPPSGSSSIFRTRVLRINQPVQESRGVELFRIRK